MAQSPRLKTLEDRHAALEQQIVQEDTRPRPDTGRAVPPQGREAAAEGRDRTAAPRRLTRRTAHPRAAFSACRQRPAPPGAAARRRRRSAGGHPRSPAAGERGIQVAWVHRPRITGSRGLMFALFQWVGRAPWRWCPWWCRGAWRPPVGKMRVVAEQPGDAVRPVVALGNGRVAAHPWPALRHRKGARKDLQARPGIGFATRDLLARELAVGDRVVADDALRDLPISDGLDLQRVHADEIGHLLEGEGSLLDQPHGGGFGHERLSHGGTFRSPQRAGARASPAGADGI